LSTSTLRNISLSSDISLDVSNALSKALNCNVTIYECACVDLSFRYGFTISYDGISSARAGYVRIDMSPHLGVHNKNELKRAIIDRVIANMGLYLIESILKSEGVKLHDRSDSWF
jgi:hypothetical protein